MSACRFFVIMNTLAHRVRIIQFVVVMIADSRRRNEIGDKMKSIPRFRGTSSNDERIAIGDLLFRPSAKTAVGVHLRAAIVPAAAVI
jgi:hypothetical protein